ncbi:unnamed protein product [Euphydryas editha]|uniref:Uncharacterized protein n=1 Tax=Euphydryas editha TaxID=104508 RepID=A0AAU9UT36_EUPED|nr:unnamed protein product [Euphydryas editha]
MYGRGLADLQGPLKTLNSWNGVYVQMPDFQCENVSLGLPRAAIHEILKKDLKFRPYKIQIVQELKENDYILRKPFCETMLQRFQTVNSILWSDKAHSHLNGHVKKQICLYWAPRTCNPRLKHQKPLHCLKLTVWCALFKHGIIGPFSLKMLEAR